MNCVCVYVCVTNVCVFQEHLNFTCSASSLGNLLLSVRHEEDKEQEHLHIIIR